VDTARTSLHTAFTSLDTARTILVIGGGPAGTFAAIAAKKQDPAATVVLLTEEPCEPYEKPPLSKAVLTGVQMPDDARIAGPHGVTHHAVVLEVHAHCAAIDRAGHAVVLADGRRLAYSALVIATGATARELPHLPRTMPGVHYLRTEADARRLRAELRPGRRMLVVGGGLIGLEVAASAAEVGLVVTVVEMAPRLLARVCDEDTSAIVQRAHVRHGVRIRLDTLISRVAPQPDGTLIAEPNSGDRIPADMIVVGTGSKPNDALAVAAGLRVDDGIVVNERCESSDPDILAAGDVVRFPGPHGLVRLENWQHALDQGDVAGSNAAGGAKVYASLPSFWSEQYDLYLQGVGWPVHGVTRIRRPMPDGAALVFEVQRGRIVQAMGINARREMATIRRLIEREIAIDPASLADPAHALATLLKR
jgi:3-phenylpropionate/trans-cinnamate dioxygenase ferredoxin reductase component